MIVFMLLLFSINVISYGYHTYDIAHFVDHPTHDYVFKSYGPCLPLKKVDAYSLVRFDESNSKWNRLDNAEIKSKVQKVCTYSNIRCPVFRAKKFLALIRNKRVGFLGDSIGRQLFEGVVNQLSVFATKFYNGSHYSTSHQKETNLIYYQAYNATIYFCVNTYIDMRIVQEPLNLYCTKQYYGPTTDYLIIGFGTWYKPKFYEGPTDFHQGPDYSYNRSYAVSQVLLADAMQSARTYINTTNRNTKVIWRLHPHVGRIDELTMYHNVTGLDHTDGLYWSNSSLGSHWVPVYNDIIRSKAAAFGDHILDWYTLSIKYMDYFTPLGLAMHVDSLHYCLSGVPRGGALLLQDVLYDIVNGGKKGFGK